MSYQLFRPLGIGLLLPLFLLPVGCVREPQGQAQPQSPDAEQLDQPPLVDVAIAQAPLDRNALSYTGTTTPLQTVSVRSRTEGQLLSLTADVGEVVSQGTLLARLDGDLIQIEIQEAQAELAARQFEVEQARAELSEARAQVEQANAALKQAQADANRFAQLAAAGAATVQTAEVAATERDTAVQVLKATQEQVNNRQRAIASLERRVAVQQAVIAQALERATYARIAAPLTGVVLARSAEPGDVIQPGQTLLEIGDLSAIHVVIQVSDRDLNQFVQGQAVQVQLDAFAQQTFRGEVTQISPVADAAARLVPVEVTIPNPGGRIGSGLLARVSVATVEQQTIRIPETAVGLAASGEEAVIFVPGNNEAETRLEARPVQLGKRDNGQVEILSGLRAGEAFVVQSDTPLEGGQTVRRSFLSDS